MEKSLWEHLKTAQKPIFLYGMGNGADKVIAALDSRGVQISGVFATDTFIRKKVFHGFELLSYETVKEKYGQIIVLVCFGTSRTPVIDNIKRIAAEQELYAPYVPVYGDDIFDEEFISRNKEQLDAVYAMLADELSRKTFKNILNYRLSGKPHYLFDCECPPDDAFRDILKLGGDEIYADFGAYNGDTVETFIKHTGTYKAIYAVEPDVKTFKKLQQNTKKYKDIHLINAGISDHCGEIPFKMRAGRNSSAAPDGQLCPIISADALFEDIDVSFIKADVEGEELNMLSGAENTIKMKKPKMMISCYHKTEDIFTIPLKVASYRRDYKIYLRHRPHIPAWDTNYFFM